MERLYLKEGLSKKELGIRYNCDPCVIDRIIIQNYPLSPIDDADKLYEIAVKDKELNNPNNLITVCSMCHHKIHGQL